MREQSHCPLSRHGTAQLIDRLRKFQKWRPGDEPTIGPYECIIDDIDLACDQLEFLMERNENLEAST